MSDWIEHDGKGAPELPAGTLVKVVFRDMKGADWMPEPFEYWLADDSDPHDCWTHDGTYNDIIAYREVQP